MNEEPDRSFLEIDLNHLEEEWRDQPKLYCLWAEKLAHAKRSVRDLEDDLKITDAEIAKEVRDDPIQFGLKKTTDKAIDQEVLIHQRHRAAVRKLNSFKHQVDVLQAVVIGLDHRRKALENEVDLHGQMYFSMPVEKNKASRDVGTEMLHSKVTQKPKRRKQEKED